MMPRSTTGLRPRATRVVFVVPGGFAGSSMIFAQRQATSLREEGAEVSIFHLQSRISPARLLLDWARLRKYLRQNRPDVVHAHFGTVTGLFTALAARGHRLVITYRGSDLNPASASASTLERVRAGAGRLLSQGAALRADRIVCVSAQLNRRLWWRRDRVIVLPSGVDAGVFFPEPQAAARARLGWTGGDCVVLFNAGHDSRIKRLDLAESSTALARTSVPGLRLHVLDGSTPPEKMPTFMNAADCLLVTSDAEGSPTVVQEALACNLPVVSVDVGDAVERLRGVSRTRIVTRDPRRIAAALAEVLAERGRSDGRAKLDEFSARHVAAKLHRLYLELGVIGSPAQQSATRGRAEDAA